MALVTSLMVAEKKCRKCGEIKPVVEFHKNRHNSDGYAKWCKECRRVYNKAYGEKKRAVRETKKCCRCKVVKKLSEFHYDEIYKAKYSRLCKSCSPISPRDKRPNQKTNRCIDCGVAVSYGAERCVSCASKRRRKRAEDSIAYKDRLNRAKNYSEEATLTVFIYGLALPNGEIFYVGQSLQPEQRFVAHRSKGTPEVMKKIDELLSKNLSPRLVIFEECDSKMAMEKEAFWIANMLLTGHPLLNRNIPNFRLMGLEVADFIDKQKKLYQATP